LIYIKDFLRVTSPGDTTTKVSKVSIASHNSLRMVRTQREKLYTYNVSFRILLHGDADDHDDDDDGSFICTPKRVA